MEPFGLRASLQVTRPVRSDHLTDKRKAGCNRFRDFPVGGRRQHNFPARRKLLLDIYLNSLKIRHKVLARLGEQDLSVGIIPRGFLSTAERKELLSLARDGSAEHRIARRANAILLLDDGLSCERAARVLYLDDDTVRGWRKLYDERGIAAWNNSMPGAVRAVSP